MKKHLTLSLAGRLIVFVEIVLCLVATLTVLMVNGTDSFTADHLSLLLLIGITVASVVLLKARKALHQKAVLWMSVLPLLFISYQSLAAFLFTHHA